MWQILRFFYWTVPILLWDFIRLMAFVVCLFPGFMRFAWYYWVSAHRISVRYGHDSCRQTLDVYTVHNNNNNNNNDNTTTTDNINIVSTSSSEEDNGSIDSSTDQPEQYQDEINDDDDEEQEEEEDDEDNNGEDDAPSQNLVGAPVVIFYTGGAWVIGYKMWGTLLARALNAAGIVVVIPDLRNYPWASVPAMVEDVDHSLEWTLNNIAEYGGDKNKIVIVGQSAGGHVACTSLLRRAKQVLRASEPPSSTATDKSSLTNSSSSGSSISDMSNGHDRLISWRPKDFKGFISLSAPLKFDLMGQTFEKHGLDGHLIDRIFGGETVSKAHYDPYTIVQSFGRNHQIGDHLPPMKIYHGSTDRTVPSLGSEEFAEALCAALPSSHPTSFTLYLGWSHTDPILEGPMDSDNRFHRDLFELVGKWTDTASSMQWPEDDPTVSKRLCPHFMIQMGRYCNPF